MLTVEIAGVPVRIENQYPYLRQMCRDYLAEGADPAFTVSVTRQEVLKESRTGATPYRLGHAEGTCVLRKLCEGLLEYDAFLLHAAVAAVDGEAYAFAAASGTGKTTHLKLWQAEFGARVEVVNGDKPFLRFGAGGRLYACGTPWRGKEGCGSNITRPLRAVCFLRRGTENQIRRLEAGQAARRLFRYLWVPQEAAQVDRLVGLADRMLSTVPCYLLDCRADRAAARLSYGVMSGTEGESETC